MNNKTNTLNHIHLKDDNHLLSERKSFNEIVVIPNPSALDCKRLSEVNNIGFLSSVLYLNATERIRQSAF